MNKFKKIPASKKSLSMRKLVFGVGINDADYVTRIIIDGKKVTCPAYRKWTSMIARCYSPKALARNPTYEECTVCDEWLAFSSFAVWFEANNVDGYDLDKDLIKKGNKIYSPVSCAFVPKSINLLLNDHARKSGDWPTGVYFNKQAGKLKSQISVDGKVIHLGYFLTPEEALLAYREAKNAEIMRKSKQYPDLASHLINHLLGEGYE